MLAWTALSSSSESPPSDQLPPPVNGPFPVWHEHMIRKIHVACALLNAVHRRLLQLRPADSDMHRSGFSVHAVVGQHIGGYVKQVIRCRREMLAQ